MSVFLPIRLSATHCELRPVPVCMPAQQRQEAIYSLSSLPWIFRLLTSSKFFVYTSQFSDSFRINFSQDQQAAKAAVDRIITMIERYRA